MFCIPKSNGHSNAKDHKQPIDLRDVYLAMNFLRCVYNFYSREAAQGLALVDDWECSADDCLTSDYRSQNCQYKHWPSDLIWSLHQRKLHMNSTGIEFLREEIIRRISVIGNLIWSLQWVDHICTYMHNSYYLDCIKIEMTYTINVLSYKHII